MMVIVKRKELSRAIVTALGVACIVFIADLAQAQGQPYQSTFSGAMTADQYKMMQLQNQANQSSGQAAAASMARSANLQLQRQQEQAQVSRAAELKRVKAQAREQMRYEQAANAYQPVSAGQINGMQRRGQMVRGSVPDEFLMSLLEQERAEATRRKKEKPRGLSRLNPFAKRRDEPASGIDWTLFQDAEPEVTGLRMPKPDRPIGEPRPDERAGNLQPDFLQQSSARATSSGPGSGLKSMGGKILGAPGKLFSRGANAVGNATSQMAESASQVGRSSERALTNTSTRGVSQLPRTSQAVASAGAAATVGSFGGQAAAPVGAATAALSQSVAPVVQAAPERRGLLGRNKTETRQLASLPSIEKEKKRGLFGFGRRKAGPEPAALTGSLFPDEVIDQNPTGGQLRSGYVTPESNRAEEGFATSSVALPSLEHEKERRGFFLKKLKPSLPKVSASKIGGGGSADVPTLTTINRLGTDIYTLTGTAQFMAYGEGQMDAEIRSLPAGTRVRMTKPGEKWAGIVLADGSQGIVQNRDLQPAAN